MRTTQPSSTAARVAGGSSSSSRRVTPCCSKVGLKRGPWTPEEDRLLIDYISKEGEGRWRTMPKKAGLLRCGKSCRLRWMNYLRPTVKRGHISPDEEDLILRLHRLLGNRWSLIAGRIPGRTDNEIKNYWNTHLTKKLISQGIDPKTHKPLENPSDENIENNQTSSAPIKTVAAFPIPLTNEEQVNVVEEQVNLQDKNNSGGHGTGNQMNVDGGGMISMGDNDEDIEMDFCTDEVFFSFFDSLMNDDTFISATATVTAAAQNNGNIVPSSSEKPSSVPSNQMSFPFSTAGWDDNNDHFLP